MVRLGYVLALAAACAPATPAASAPAESEITAIGQRNQGPEWLGIYGPGSDGIYSARIDLTGLDLAGQPGQTEMASRVRRGVRVLCSYAVFDPSRHQQVVTPERVRLDCFHDTYASVAPRMAAIERIGAQPHLAMTIATPATRAR